MVRQTMKSGKNINHSEHMSLDIHFGIFPKFFVDEICKKIFAEIFGSEINCDVLFGDKLFRT